MADVEAQSRELGRRTGSLVTPAELAELQCREVRLVDREVVSYAFESQGRVPPPVRLTVTCSPDATDGVMRTMSKVLESRGWAARVERRQVREVAE